MSSEFNGEKPLPILPDELCLSMAESYLQQKAVLNAKLNLKETSPWQTTPKAIQNVETQLKTLEVRPANDLNLRNGLRLLKIRQKEQEQQSLQIMPQLPEVAKRPVSEFGQAIRPLAQAARDAHRTIKTIEGLYPNTDLWPLPIYRNPDLNPRFEQHLIATSKELSPNGKKTQLVLAVGRTLSRHITEGPWTSIPTEFRDQAKVAREVAEVADWITKFEEGTLEIPTPAELGRSGPEQLKHAEHYVIAVLAHYLLQELKNPHLTEKELRRLYQGLSNQINSAAKWMDDQSKKTKNNGMHWKGNEIVCTAINNLPPVAGVLITSRLSTQRYTDLGFPCNSFLSEERIAEVFSNIGYAYQDKRRRREGIKEKTGHQIDTILDTLSDRMEAGDINLTKMFAILEELDYGDIALEGIYNGANPQGKETLIQALDQCSGFDPLKRKLKKHYFSEVY